MEAGIVILVIVIVLLVNSLKIVTEFRRGVVLTLGKYSGIKGPGVVWIWPIVQTMRQLDLRVVTLDVPTQEVITKDNVTVKVNAVVFFKVLDPKKAYIEVENFDLATSQISQTTMRSVCGNSSLDEILSHRERLNDDLQSIIDAATDPWGIKVLNVELKDVELPIEMQRAMAKQAEAERERRAKVINAQGEFQASAKLAEAADVIGAHPSALQLRFLQTLTEVSSEKNSTIIFPIPLDLFEPFLDGYRKLKDGKVPPPPKIEDMPPPPEA